MFIIFNKGTNTYAVIYFMDQYLFLLEIKNNFLLVSKVRAQNEAGLGNSFVIAINMEHYSH